MSTRLDPHNINSRVQKLLDRILTRVESTAEENVSLRDLLTAVVYVSRVQTAFVGLRKEKSDEPAAGASVRKYSKAFTGDAVGKRKKAPRSAAADYDLDLDDDDQLGSA